MGSRFSGTGPRQLVQASADPFPTGMCRDVCKACRNRNTAVLLDKTKDDPCCGVQRDPVSRRNEHRLDLRTSPDRTRQFDAVHSYRSPVAELVGRFHIYGVFPDPVERLGYADCRHAKLEGGVSGNSHLSRMQYAVPVEHEQVRLGLEQFRGLLDEGQLAEREESRHVGDVDAVVPRFRLYDLVSLVVDYLYATDSVLGSVAVPVGTVHTGDQPQFRLVETVGQVDLPSQTVLNV